MADVKGQRLAWRALEVAAAGRHNLLLVGPPGAGKTMMVKRLSGLLPATTFDEAVETTTIHSVVGLVQDDTGLVITRPFRAPHHTASDVALVGGVADPRPGEVSLAHNGVLFLDEMPEFGRRALEVLRQPLAEEVVRIARASGVAVFPARFMLVGAMNPCPCRFAGDPSNECRCTPDQIERCHGRLSGPLRDRFDLTVSVGPVPPDALASSGGRRVDSGHSPTGNPSTRKADGSRSPRHSCEQRGLGPFPARDRLSDRPGRRLVLERAISRFRLSARGFDRLRRVSKTLADL